MEGLIILQRCPISACRQQIEILNMDSHLYTHYNYCKYGHYEEFDVGDPRWPECMNEKGENV